MNTVLSLLVFSIYFILFFFKNEKFGADTLNYITEFTNYCRFPANYIGLDYTYLMIFKFINLLMLGNCEVSWLMWIWPLFIIGLTIYLCMHFKIEMLYIIALFSSFIGGELLTNAMRQGFSLAILMLAFCFYLNKKYVSFLFFSALSLLFHQASFLIIAIVISSRFSYKIFMPGVFVSIYLAFFTSYLDFLPGVEGFRTSILRYLPYSSDDFIVRLISILTLIITYVVFLWVLRKEIFRSLKSLNTMNNIICICMIVSMVPYFGFRIVYGIYPLFLLLAYTEIKKINGQSFLFLSIITLINSVITIVWLSASSYMRSISFVNIT
ncbi:EpsG family protein [Buttiauxella sp. S04-F03]|nr:EpsG family protein [Buttiauxella sp. W03-F01]MCE0800529.1 EpsG family protein [Buttiauxella sp. W03-F01]